MPELLIKEPRGGVNLNPFEFSSSRSMTLPTNIAEGDLLILFWGLRTGSDESARTLTGWTQVGAYNNTPGAILIFTRTADGTEGGTVVTLSGTAIETAAECVVIPAEANATFDDVAFKHETPSTSVPTWPTLTLSGTRDYGVALGFAYTVSNVTFITNGVGGGRKRDLAGSGIASPAQGAALFGVIEADVSSVSPGSASMSGTVTYVLATVFINVPRPSGPAPTVVGTPVAVSNTSTTSVTLDKPTGVQEGDVLVAYISARDGTQSATAVGSGWTRYDTPTKPFELNSQANHIFVKVATASEPASYQFNAQNNTQVSGTLAAFRGVGTIGASNVCVNSESKDATDTDVGRTPRQVTNGGENALLVNMMHTLGANSFTPPGGMTELLDTLQNNMAMAVGAEELTTYGVLGSRIWTELNSGSQDAWGAIVLNPVSSGVSARFGMLPIGG